MNYQPLCPHCKAPVTSGTWVQSMGYSEHVVVVLKCPSCHEPAFTASYNPRLFKIKKGDEIHKEHKV